MTSTSLLQWRYQDAPHYTTPVINGTIPNYAEKYQHFALTTFSVNMLAAPGGQNRDILFYPGTFYRAIATPW